MDCAHCKLFNKSFRIDGGGNAQVKSHQRSRSHKDRENISSGSSNQTTCIVGSKTVNFSPGTFALTQEEIFVQAEIFQALQYVEWNYSSASAAKDSEKFKAMFPGSEIAKNYRQGETKVRYNIQFGIARILKIYL